MKLFELYLTPLDAKQFRVMVTLSAIASDAEADTTLPFWAEAEDWRTTIVKTLEATGWRSDIDVFARTGEQDWMIAANILSGKRDNFAPDYLAWIGQALYDSLFPTGRIREAFQVALRGAEAADEALHLRLKFPAEAAKRSRLADYPWELLHDGQRFLLNRDVYLSRYIAYEGVPPSLPVQAKIQVLLVSPRPANVAQLPDTEQQALRDGIAKAELVGLVALKQLSKPTLKDLSRHLTECDPVPQVIHFDGHGIFGKKCGNDRCRQYVNPGMAAKTCRECGQTLPEAQGFLVFEDEAGQADYVSATSFAALLPKGIVLVVLSACQSGMAISGDSVFNGTAQQLIDARVPAVVAMQYKVSVAAASGFVEQFYRVLGQRRSVLEATNAGRKWMGVDGNQWYRPVVYLRWRDNDGGQLFAESSDRDLRSSGLSRFQRLEIDRFQRLEIDRLQTQLTDLDADYEAVKAQLRVELNPVTQNSDRDLRSSGLSRFQRFEIDRLQTQLTDLDADYEAVKAQLRVELNPVTQNILKRQIQQIGQTMDEIEKQLAELG
jgi:hypothetical protein